MYGGFAHLPIPAPKKPGTMRTSTPLLYCNSIHAAIAYIDNLCRSDYSEGRRVTLPMNVSLTPELENFVSTKVQSGRYNSASEVVREALRLLEEHDVARAAQLAEFNQEVGRRLATLDRGEVVDPTAARARLQHKSEQRRKTRA
jgi:antitoxin ParD1/3/4